MRKFGLVFAVAAIAASGASPVSAEELSLKCPPGKMVQRIVNEVPAGWQQFDKVGTLVMSSVSNKNGATILSCNYGPAGNLYQVMPKPYIGCAAAHGGFSCVKPQRPRRRRNDVVSSGRIKVKLGQMADLDTGKSDVTYHDGDIWFMGGFGPFAIVESLDNSRFAAAGDERRLRRKCENAEYTDTRIVIGRDVQPGGVVCVRTSRNRIGVMHIENYDRNNLQVEFRTWR